MPLDPPPGARRPGPARSLTLEDITRAAVAVADRHGLEAMTMRSLARELGTSAPALYRYVASRDELVGDVVDRVAASVTHPAHTGNWVQDLTAGASALRRAFLDHPWLPAALAIPAVAGPHVLDHLDWCLAALEPVRAPSTAKMEAIALLTGVAAIFSTSSTPPHPQAFRHLEPSRHPRLAALVAEAPPGVAGEDLFERVVAGILHGILDAPPTRPRT